MLNNNETNQFDEIDLSQFEFDKELSDSECANIFQNGHIGACDGQYASKPKKINFK